jgi:DNA-binding winged helix-turn-helix (wHTH) protein
MDKRIIRIGKWQFVPDSNELRCDTEVRRIEDRASRMLLLFAERRGDVVCREDIIATIWNGRQLSENSIATVVGQLRRLLDDDPMSPTLIETIPKKGYRLAGQTGRSEKHFFKLRWALLLIPVLLFAGWIVLDSLRPPLLVHVAPISNNTGDLRYAPLAKAAEALLITELSKRGVRVQRTATENDVTFQSKLILWEGEPFLALDAVHDRKVIWSAMIGGGKGAIPRELEVELKKWAETQGLK